MAELCYCCGQVLLRSGSRWSVWFCKECKEQVGLLHGRLGRYVIPIGRYSLHAGFRLGAKPGEPEFDLAVELYVDKLQNLFQAMDVVWEWSGIVVREVLTERWPEALRANPDAPESPSIEAYLERCRSDENEKMRRFREMVGSFERAGR
ncbi:hypothetical protein ACFL3S_04905 [Gemmatimonadota bacterium]